MPPKPRFRQQFPKQAFCGALEEASASSELGCAGLDLIRRSRAARTWQRRGGLFKRSAQSADPSQWSGGLVSVCLWVCGSEGSEGSVGLRGLWVCGSVCQQGLLVCRHGCMAGLVVWGSCGEEL